MADETPGKTIAALRKRATLTQTQLAERACVTLRAVQAWESDEASPSPRRRATIAEALGVEPDVIWPLPLTVDDQLDRIEAALAEQQEALDLVRELARGNHELLMTLREATVATAEEAARRLGEPPGSPDAGAAPPSTTDPERSSPRRTPRR